MKDQADHAPILGLDKHQRRRAEHMMLDPNSLHQMAGCTISDFGVVRTESQNVGRVKGCRARRESGNGKSKNIPSFSTGRRHLTNTPRWSGSGLEESIQYRTAAGRVVMYEDSGYSGRQIQQEKTDCSSRTGAGLRIVERALKT